MLAMDRIVSQDTVIKKTAAKNHADNTYPPVQQDAKSREQFQDLPLEYLSCPA